MIYSILTDKSTVWNLIKSGTSTVYAVNFPALQLFAINDLTVKQIESFVNNDNVIFLKAVAAQ